MGQLKNNGWMLVGKCFKCGYLGSSKLVCPSCGDLVERKQSVVAKWVSTRKWWEYFFFVELGAGGYWEEKKRDY